jgi:hypothetical protein
MNLFSQPIHAAVAEHRTAQHRLGLAAIEGNAEVPRLDPLVPVVGDIRDVTILLSEHEEVRPLPVV